MTNFCDSKIHSGKRIGIDGLPEWLLVMMLPWKIDLVNFIYPNQTLSHDVVLCLYSQFEEISLNFPLFPLLTLSK